MLTHAFNQHINSTRLIDYDYSQPGAYFVTLCTNFKIDMFGEVVDNEMRLNNAGEIAREMWKTIPERFPGVELDHFVIMPNHRHGIVVITAESYESKRKPTLGDIIRTYKAVTTHNIRRAGIAGFGWQYNYYEHIIRTNHPKALDTIRQYIENNPSRWMEDKLNSMPANMW